MKINSNFNRFHHGAIINDMFNQRSFISFGFLGIIDTQTSQPFTIVKGEDYTKASDNNDCIKSPFTLKNWLKLADVNYPRGADTYPISTTKLTSKQVTEHEEFIRLVAANNGFSLSVDDEEWNRLINSYKK